MTTAQIAKRAFAAAYFSAHAEVRSGSGCDQLWAQYWKEQQRLGATEAAESSPAPALVGREQIETLIAEWRAFDKRTRRAEAALPAGLMDETRARMRGLADQAYRCAVQLSALIVPPQE